VEKREKTKRWPGEKKKNQGKKRGPWREGAWITFGKNCKGVGSRTNPKKKQGNKRAHVETWVGVYQKLQFPCEGSSNCLGAKNKKPALGKKKTGKNVKIRVKWRGGQKQNAKEERGAGARGGAKGMERKRKAKNH